MSNFADYSTLQVVYGSILGRLPLQRIDEIRPAYEVLRYTLDLEAQTPLERSTAPALNVPLVNALQNVNSHLLPALQHEKMYTEIDEIRQVCNSIVGRLPR